MVRRGSRALAVLLLATTSTAASSTSLPLRTVRDVPLAGGTSRFDYQSLDPRTHRLFIAHLGAGMVTVFDTRTNRVVAEIPHLAGVHGVLAIPQLQRVYASATDNHQIDVIDERTLRVVARTKGGDYPDGLAYDPINRRVFVSDESGQAVIVVNARTNHYIARIPLGGEAGNTQYDPGSHRIFVAVQTLNQLVSIDPTTNRILRRSPLPGCRHDHGLYIDEARRLAFVACDENARLLTVDLRSLRVFSIHSVGPVPDVLAFDSTKRRLYVAAESGVLAVFNEHGQTIQKDGQGFVAEEAHTVAVDSQTHRVYIPLENSGGRPVLRVMVPTGQ